MQDKNKGGEETRDRKKIGGHDARQKQVCSNKDASEVRGKHRNAEKVRADLVVYCRFFPYFFAGHLQFICRLDGWTDSPAKQSRSQSITFSAIL